VTLYYRQDFDPTIAYSSTPMVDDGAHGDGAPVTSVCSARPLRRTPGRRALGLHDSRATTGTNVSPGPSGHNTLARGSTRRRPTWPKFSTGPDVRPILRIYHLITTQRTRKPP
jgi:hypothetical protein